MTPYCALYGLVNFTGEMSHVHCDYSSEPPLKVLILLQNTFLFHFHFLPKRIITICRSFNFLSYVTIRYKTYLSFSR